MEAAKVGNRLFPGDMVVDIIVRLPVKSLKRFRSVAKSWCSLIQSREFISAHYSHDTKTKPKVRPLIKHDEGKIAVVLLSEDNNGVTNFDMPPSLTTSINPSRLRMLGCCNGIVCLWNGGDGVAFWNLATKEFKIIPCNLSRHHGFWLDAMGFGYDSNGDDYKVVRIYRVVDNRHIPQQTRVALYNLATNSWRVFNAGFRFNIQFQHGNERNQVYTSNGFYHFGGYLHHDHKQEQSLLSFDFANEMFATTPFPDALHDFRCQLMEFRGSLGLLCYHQPTDYCVESVGYDVWVLGEVSVKSSWTKLFTTQPISMDLYLLGAGGINGDQLFFSKTEPEGRVMLVWNRHPCSEQETLTPIVDGLGSFIELEMYAESLVSLSN